MILVALINLTIGVAFLLFGLALIVWARPIQQRTLEYLGQKQAAGSPVLEWVKSSTFIWSLRVYGAFAIAMAAVMGLIGLSGVRSL